MTVKTNSFSFYFSLRLNMNLILLRFLFIKGRSYLYNSLIITKQLVQWFILSYTRSKSFHLPLTDNFQYHLSVLCNFEQIFHSGYHNHSIPWNSWSIQSHPCSLCSMMSIQSCAVLHRQWFWAGPQSQDPTCGQVHTVTAHTHSHTTPCALRWQQLLWLDPFSLCDSWLVRTMCLLLPHL